MLSEAPILVQPQCKGDFLLDTDAIGVVLSQVQDGQEKVIVNGSKLLNKTVHCYCIIRKELLAVVHFVS